MFKTPPKAWLKGFFAVQMIFQRIKNGIMRDPAFYRVFLTLTLTVALRNVIVFTVNLADNVMLGNYSEEAMSGVALVNQIQFLLQLLVTGAAEGAQIFISRAWGGRDGDTIKKMVNIGVKAALAVSLVVFAVVTVAPSGVLSLLSGSEAFVREGTGYLRIISFSYPIFAVTTALIVANNSVETPKLGFYTSLGALFVNMGLNFVLIYGKLGFPEMGARGAAVATLIARCTECLIVVFYTFRIDKKIGLALRDILRRIDTSLFRDYLRKGLPVFFSSLIWGVAMTVQLAILGHMGDSAVTANSISNTLFQIVTVVTYASAGAAAVMTAKVIGEGKEELVRPYARSFQLMFLCIGAVTGTLIFLLKDVIVLLYGDVSPESREMALQFMTVLSVTSVGSSYQMPCHTGIVRGGGDTSFVFKVDSIFMWGIILPSAVISAFVLKLSPLMVFIVLKCDQVIKCAVAAIKVNSFNWVKSVRTKGGRPV